MASSLKDIELTKFDDLFKSEEERQADQLEQVLIVPAEQVFPYARQPYAIERPTADLVRLMDSIEKFGIMDPLIVRPREAGGYEIVAGHRRNYCAGAVSYTHLDVYKRQGRTRTTGGTPGDWYMWPWPARSSAMCRSSIWEGGAQWCAAGPPSTPSIW